ncbi:hypothetical protein ACB092_02G242500 [Castanea dentata]
MDNISVPSTLARLGLASNSFSMCFGPDGIGRIKFGDNGSSDQRKTPFNIRSTHPTYNISITQTTVGKIVSALELSAIFDSGTSFTSLKDPAYTFISESFNSQVLERRHPSDSQIPFEYCYDLSVNLSQPNYTINITIPDINLTMKGGDQYSLIDPLAVVTTNKGGYMYCLALLKNEVINIIGQNFMTGYNIVFDREKVVLGWKASNCYDDENFSTLPISPSHSPAYSPAHSPAYSPAHSPAAVNPEATANSGTNSDPPVSPPSSYSPKLKPFHYTLAMLLLSFLAIV